MAVGRQMKTDGMKTGHQRTETKQDMTEGRSLTMIFLSLAIARDSPSDETTIERISWVCWMELS